MGSIYINKYISFNSWFLFASCCCNRNDFGNFVTSHTTLGFDPYWFAIVFTINMEIGLITPPVGLNLYIIKGITPDVSLKEILKGSIPFMIIMALAILILCIFPEIVTWLPDKIMGKALGY